MKGLPMVAKTIDGKVYADGLADRIREAVLPFRVQTGRAPGLAVVLVGIDPASEVYVRMKGRKARELGLESFEHILPETVNQAELMALITELNSDDDVDGILVQLPLPKHLNEFEVISLIDPQKDVDGLHPENVGRLLAGQPSFVSCTPLGCLMLLKDRLGDLSGLDAIVVGRSILVGKPMAQLLLNAHCTVTMAHSKTRHLTEKVRQADIVVAAAGQPRMVKADWIKPGATIIDVGTTPMIETGKKRLIGDVDFLAAREVAGAITPVPGGVGPMTIVTLMHNTVMAAYRRAGLPAPELW
jgi:methylenetetrahydrofolate dehydrogenase (NADP+)/methenyltetrahydrofolate cyclohydrolase